MVTLASEWEGRRLQSEDMKPSSQQQNWEGLPVLSVAVSGLCPILPALVQNQDQQQSPASSLGPLHSSSSSAAIGPFLQRHSGFIIPLLTSITRFPVSPISHTQGSLWESHEQLELKRSTITQFLPTTPFFKFCHFQIPFLITLNFQFV